MIVRHVILDRDGVLNRESPDGGWVHHAHSWQWEDSALAGLELLASAGMRISVATNQSGVGRGVFPLSDVDAVHKHMVDETETHDGRIDAIFVCPHAPSDNCRCRKPGPGLLEQAIESSGIAAGETLFIGDAARDLEAARCAGVVPVLVRSGKGRFTEQQLDDSEINIYDNLLDAAQAILHHIKRGGNMSIQKTFDEHADVMRAAADTLAGDLQAFVDLTVSCIRSGRKVMVCGNGGSAADAQHLAAELVCRFAFNRGALPALALTTDTSTLTAIGNDLGYDRIFSRQVEALAQSGDLLVAISTSGRSANVIEAARQARAKGCTVVAMTGEESGPLGDLADLVIVAPSSKVARIQEVHAITVHILAETVEHELCRETTT